VTQFIIQFPTYLVEKGTQQLGLVQLVLLVTHAKNRKVSSSSFEFWTHLYEIIRNSGEDFSWLVEPLLALLEILLKKCRLKSLEFKLVQDIYSHDSDTEDLDEFSSSITFEQYRSEAEDVYLALFRILRKYQQEPLFFGALFRLLSGEGAAREEL